MPEVFDFFYYVCGQNWDDKRVELVVQMFTWKTRPVDSKTKRQIW
jgi:hypothetical protein